MMSLGNTHAVVCLEAIPDSEDQKAIFKSIEKSERSIIEISLRQVERFCGNVLQLKNTQGKKFWVVSKTAFEELTNLQRDALLTDGEILSCDLATIESLGGGSARCMICEIF
jgi:hypothetical protein